MADVMWTFSTDRFCIRWEVEFEHGYKYDGDDPGGQVQMRLDDGELVAFESAIVVELVTPHGNLEIAADYLGGSVYEAHNVKDFASAHRGSDPMDRNSSIMRAARGGNVAICHYFPCMVRQAVAEARRALKDLPHVRDT